MSARNCSKDGISRRRSSSQCRWWMRNNSTRRRRVVFSQPMFIAPLGDGLGELLVEVGLFVGRHSDHSGAKSKSVTDSISA